MATPTKLMSFAEFEQLPDRPGFRQELHHGELVEVAPPKSDHFMIQQMLRDLLDQAGRASGRAYTEVGFRPLPEREFYVVDVAFASHEWWKRFYAVPYFLGVPDLVIEVLSPSNTVSKINEKAKLCLENGSREFWTVDRNIRQVKVSAPSGETVTYRLGQEIPLYFAPDTKVSVDAIFAPPSD